MSLMSCSDSSVPLPNMVATSIIAMFCETVVCHRSLSLSGHFRALSRIDLVCRWDVQRDHSLNFSNAFANCLHLTGNLLRIGILSIIEHDDQWNNRCRESGNSSSRISSACRDSRSGGNASTPAVNCTLRKGEPSNSSKAMAGNSHRTGFFMTLVEISPRT